MSFTWKCPICRVNIIIEDADSPEQMNHYATPFCSECYSTILMDDKQHDSECIIETIQDNGMPMYITPDGLIFACKTI